MKTEQRKHDPKGANCQEESVMAADFGSESNVYETDLRGSDDGLNPLRCHLPRYFLPRQHRQRPRHLLRHLPGHRRHHQSRQ